MINFIMNKSVAHKKQIVYAFYYLSLALNDELMISSHMKSECLNIYYGKEPEGKNCVYIPELNRDECRKIKFIPYKEYYLACFEDAVKSPYVFNDGIVSFHFDILSASLHLLTCGEEYKSNKRDCKGRFTAELSQRRGSIDIPYFDMNARVMCEGIQRISSQVPEKADGFEVLLTHDVDNLDSRNRYILMHNVKDLLRKDNRKLRARVLKLLGDMTFNRYSQIESCINLENNYDAKSEFYFIAGKKHRFGRRYSFRQIKKQVNLIKPESQFAIGLHTNYFSYNDENEIKKEIKQIESLTGTKIQSCRNHYLRFTVPHTWEKLRDAGIVYDTTLGYPDKNGFRAGTAMSFIPYNVEKNNIIPILEIPLILMDIVVMEKSNTLRDKWDEIRTLLDSAKLFHGTVSIVWHQCAQSDPEYKFMYEKTLQYLEQIGCKFILTTDLEERFLKQKQDLLRLTNQIEAIFTE